METIQFVADRGDARLRLDQVLVRRVSEVSRLSRAMTQQWIEAGAVRVDGRVASRPSARVREGSTVEIELPESAPRRQRPEPERGDLAILFEDDSLLVVDKPPGVVVHPSYKQAAGTLLNTILWRLRDRADAQPGILTRLDKDTSGIVVVALTAAVHATLQRAAAAGRIEKTYLAIVDGTPRPRQGSIRDPLARDPGDRRRVVVTPGGAPSDTRYAVAASAGARSLVQCTLVTGRTHQIRVHLASRGWPITGDPLYGTASPEIARQALHAWRVALPHPVTDETLTLEAPMPEDMRRLASWPLHGPRRREGAE